MRFSFSRSLGLAAIALLLSSVPLQAQGQTVIRRTVSRPRQWQRPVSTNPAPSPALRPALNPATHNMASAQASVSQSILDLTNRARRQAQQGSLSLDSKLSAAAQRHADDLARGAQFSHQGSDGSTLVDRVKGSGYAYWTIGENIYYRSPNNSPDEAVQGWLRSPGHRNNMLNGTFTQLGVGYATSGDRHYYVQVFGKPQ